MHTGKRSASLTSSGQISLTTSQPSDDPPVLRCSFRRTLSGLHIPMPGFEPTTSALFPDTTSTTTQPHLSLKPLPSQLPLLTKAPHIKREDKDLHQHRLPRHVFTQHFNYCPQSLMAELVHTSPPSNTASPSEKQTTWLCWIKTLYKHLVNKLPATRAREQQTTCSSLHS